MTYFRPTELSDALSYLSENKPAIAAGCTDLFAMTDSHRLEKAGYENLLDITAIEEISGIEVNRDHIRIGAGTKWSEINNCDLPESFDGLKAAGREVGSLQIQNSGTIGGNLCNASPAADGVPPLLTLDARVELRNSEGTRTLALGEFIRGPRQTALQTDELLTAILVPATSTNGISHFIKLGARKYLVISIAMVAARIELEDDTIRQASIAVGSCSAVATRLGKLEAELKGISAGVDFNEIVTNEHIQGVLAPIDDIRADAGYRNEAALELIKRTLTETIAKGASR